MASSMVVVLLELEDEEDSLLRRFCCLRNLWTLLRRGGGVPPELFLLVLNLLLLSVSLSLLSALRLWVSTVTVPALAVLGADVTELTENQLSMVAINSCSSRTWFCS